MPLLTPANRLYLYQLLSAELGRGQQVGIARAEEVLDADGLAPRDVGCETWRELLEKLDECVRITVFKRGRVYVTVVANEAYDELLEKAARGTAKSAGNTKSFKRKKGGKDLKPERPRQVPAPVVEPEPEPVPEPAVELEPVAEAESTVEAESGSVAEAQTVVEAEPEPAVEPEPAAEARPGLEAVPVSEALPADLPESEGGEEASGEEADVASATDDTQAETLVEPDQGPEPKPELETSAESESTSVAAPEPTISLTITFDPRSEEEKDPAPILEPDPAPTLTLADVPESISRDVIVNDAALSVLSDVFPLGSDVLGILDEDLAMARSAHTFAGTRALVELPLRYALPEGERLVVRLKRKAPNRAGKRWSLQVSEGLPETGVDGLPDAALWPWSKLPSARLGVRPYVELARSVETGSWDDLLDQLRELVPTERMGAAQLAATVAAAFMDKALLYSADGQEAAFALPIATDASTPVAVFLEAQTGIVPWRVKGLVAAETLPIALSGVWPVSHATALNQLVVQPGSALDARSVCAGDEVLEAEIMRVFSRVQIRPRLAVAAFDPMAQASMLLLPLSQGVLAIAPTGERSYRALAILTREEARAIACV